MIDIQKIAYLKAMGIELWQKNQPTENAKNFLNRDTAIPRHCETQDMRSISSLKDQVVVCTKCALHLTRTNVVFGVGNPKADVLIVGEAPGANEDAQGIPFVGRAGQLLTNMFLTIDVLRDDVFIANILKCRPPNNRDPLPEEVSCCMPYLTQQMDHIQPKVIITVGRIAAQSLLNTDVTMGKLRSKVHLFKYNNKSVPLVAMYHPAYLLRSPTQKAKAYDDLLLVRHVLEDHL